MVKHRLLNIVSNFSKIAQFVLFLEVMEHNSKDLLLVMMETKKWDREGKFGDEVHEVLRLYPSINAAVGKQRALLALEQEKIESNRILLYDDALQYWRLARDVDIVVIHAQKWLGNGYGFPRGPLREGPKALQRATAVILLIRIILLNTTNQN